MAYNPFKNYLFSPSYDTINIKKVYDVFPRLLRVKQLTSEELLEELRRQVQQKDIRIEELLRLLQQLSDQTDTLQLQNLISELGNTLDSNLAGILGSLTGQSSDIALQQRIDSLKSSGYIQIQETLLFVKVDYDLGNSFPFNINHSDENGRGFPESDLQTPYSVDIINISKEKDYYFTKLENWQSNSDKNDIPSIPTNAFNFSNFINLNTSSFRVAKDSSISSPIKLGYNSKDDYDSAELTRNNQTNTWFGEMKIYASETNLSTSQVRTSVGTSIGRMRLYRDKN